MRFNPVVALLAMAPARAGEVDRWPPYRGLDGAGISESAAPVEFGPKQNVAVCRRSAARPLLAKHLGRLSLYHQL